MGHFSVSVLTLGRHSNSEFGGKRVLNYLKIYLCYRYICSYNFLSMIVSIQRNIIDIFCLCDIFEMI